MKLTNFSLRGLFWLFLLTGISIAWRQASIQNRRESGQLASNLEQFSASATPLHPKSNEEDRHLPSPAGLVARDARAELEDLLRKHPERINLHDPLSMAAEFREDRAECARILIAHGADVNARDHIGKTRLYWSAVKGHAATAEVLLEAGADVHAIADLHDSDNETALHYACKHSNGPLVELLLKYKADPNAKDSFGMTPLHRAVDMSMKDKSELPADGNVGIMTMLLDAGADINAVSSFTKQTPLYRAGNNPVGERFLRSRGALQAEELAADTR